MTDVKSKETIDIDGQTMRILKEQLLEAEKEREQGAEGFSVEEVVAQMREAVEKVSMEKRHKG